MKKRNIRCIIVAEGTTVVKYHNDGAIDLATNNYDPYRMVTIYNPKLEDKQKIAEILDESTQNGEIKVAGLSFLKMMALVTDLDMKDLTEEEALEIVNSPNDVLQAVNVELNRLFIEIIKQRYETMETLNSLPEPLLKDMLEGQIKDAEAEAKAKEAEKARKAEIAKKRAELEAQLKELDSQQIN